MRSQPSFGGMMHGTTRTTTTRSARRIVTLLAALLLAAGALAIGGVAPAAFAAPLSQCNGVGDDGNGIECDVTITNEWNLATSTGSSVVVTRVCIGAADVDFGPGDCAENTVENLDDVTLTVDQCNGSANGGGSTMRCSVTMTNTIIGTGTVGAPTVNQCNGSFDGLDPLPSPSACDPVQATTDAPIAQCNDSINGGTNVSINCTVGVSTVSSALAVTVDQCNGSVNGGGSLLECSTNITTIFQPVANGGGEGGGTGGGTDGDGTDGDGSGTLGIDGLAATGSDTAGLAGLAAAIMLLLGMTLVVTSRRATRA